MPRFIRAIRLWLDRLFCLRPTPDFETFSEPSIVIEAQPRRPITESTEGILETFSEPSIVIEAQPRRFPRS